MRNTMKILISKVIAITSIALMGLQTARINACDPVEDVKAKWIKWANDNVEYEKAKLFDYYEISSDLLNNKEIQEKLQEKLSEVDASYRSDFLDLEEDPRDPILQLAKSILSCDACKNIKIKYTHCPTTSMGITRDNATDTCCIDLNPIGLKDVSKNEITDILRHEKSHAVYHDSFNKLQISTLLFEHSPAAKKLTALRKEYYAEWKECLNEWRRKNIKDDDAIFKLDDIERKVEKNYSEYLEFIEGVSNNMSSYHKAQETRADVYAAITSPQQGDGFIASLQKSLQEELQGRISIAYHNHPHHKDRIALLQQIKSELQSAQYMTRAMRAMSDDQTF